MANVKVPVYGTVGKAVSFDPQAGARAEAAVEALAQAISKGVGGTITHRSLQGLQVGDDHPQYAMWQAPETIQGLWNFQTIPLIQGETLAEYIEDVVGGDFFDFLQDTSSVVWTYHDTANELEANVPPEFVQDTVGAMLTDSSSIDLSYNDGAGTFTAAIIDEYVQDLVGSMLTDSSTIDFTYNDLAGTFTASVIQSASYTWTGQHVWSTTQPDLRMNETDQATDERLWRFRVNGKRWSLETVDDAITASRSAMDVVRGTGIAVSTITLGNIADSPRFDFLGTGHVRLLADNQKLQIGASQDLCLYHDGSDSWVRTDTGELKLSLAGAQSFRLTSQAFAFRSTTARGGGNCYASLFDPSGEKGYFGYGGVTDDFYVANSLAGDLIFITNAVQVAKFDRDTTAGNTRFMVYDVDNGTLERVSVGAADSGGAGFKVLRIPN